MASNTIAFNLNDEKRGEVYAEQKRRRRTAISLDLFCKELLFERLTEIKMQRTTEDKKGVKND
jgi:hypothetical protein